jgi:hypothetical protein
MQNKHDKYCTIAFGSNKDLDKALEHVMYESDQGFSMLNGKTITISKSQCEMLEGIKKKEKIKYTHISQ